MCKITHKPQLLFEFLKIIKSKHSSSYVSLFRMTKNKNEQGLVYKITLDLTLSLLNSSQNY